MPRSRRPRSKMYFQTADVQPGDVVFFQNDAGKVVHVGVLLDAMTVVHAAGEVRMDSLLPNGIERDDRVTHTFHSIRRWNLKG